MRILWLGHFLPYPPRGGNLQRSHHLLRLAAERHEVHVVALTQRAILPTQADVEGACAALREIVGSVSAHAIPTDQSRFAWYALVARGLVDSRPYEELWLRAPGVREAVSAVEHTTGPVDLVHVDTLGMWQYVPRRRGVATVLNHHNVESQLMDRRATNDDNPLRRLYFRREAAKLRRAEADVCPAACVNITVSPLDAERLRGIAPRATVQVVDNGVDTEFFRASGNGAGPTPGTLLFVASMTWYPNAAAATYLADEVWPLIRERDPEATLSIVGPGPPPAVLDRAGRDQRLCVPGFVDDVRPHFEAAEIYVCPIRDGGGTRLKVLDALAMQRPIVATSVAVEGLELEPEVHFLRAETPTEFAEQVRRLRSDPALRQRVAEAGRRVAETRFSWRTIGDKLEAAYRSAAETAAARAALR